jgi:integrase
MAKQVKLDTRTARLKLPVRKKSYTNRIAVGIRLAYRRTTGAGTWSVLGGGGDWLRKIGVADDHEAADGHNILDHWQAVERAREFARAKDGDSGKPITVAEALDAYAADLVARGRPARNAERARIHLPRALASKTVALVAAHELRHWRNGLTKKMAPASVGRVARMLKAALTLAADGDARIANRDAWGRGLKGLPDGESATRGDVFIDEDTIRRIIAAAPEEGLEFGQFVEVGAVTGARPSQISRLQVADVQADRSDPRLMMPSSRKGKRKEVRRRPVPISAALALRLRQTARGRAPSTLLFLHNGKGWPNNAYYRPFLRTVRRIGLDPDAVTFYALRHSSIQRALLKGVPVRLVADLHDTSTAMIERTYSKFIADHADTVARAAMLEVEQPTVTNIVPLKG